MPTSAKTRRDPYTNRKRHTIYSASDMPSIIISAGPVVSSTDNLTMRRKNTANLAGRVRALLLLPAVLWVSTLLVQPAAGQETPFDLDRPVRVSFSLIDGKRITGEATAWGYDGIAGSFGGRLWTDIRPADVWELHRRLMDRQSIEHWVNLGRLMLLIEGDDSRRAEQAFQRAVVIERRQQQDDDGNADAGAGDEDKAGDVDGDGAGDRNSDANSTTSPSAAELIDSARREVEAHRQRQKQLDEAIASEQLNTALPQARQYPVTPWPILANQQQQQATEALRTEAAAMLQRAGLDLQPIQTRHLLVYSDLPNERLIELAQLLENTITRLRTFFKVPEEIQTFHGRVVVFIFEDEDRFRLMEAEEFNHLAPASDVGVCHQRGADVFLVFHHHREARRLESELVHELVHGFMYRYYTPRRLPAWANEGFAEYVVTQMIDDAYPQPVRRKRALAYIRSGGSIDAVLAMPYTLPDVEEQLQNAKPQGGDVDEDDEQVVVWPGPNDLGYGVGALVVELMIEQRPLGFVKWVNAIKRGENWHAALKAEYGVDRNSLINTATQYWQVND